MFEGIYTAIVTPFNRNGEVDYKKLEELVEFQVANGVDGIVPVGTTGESPTLNFHEHNKVIETVVSASAKRIKVIAGTGANSTAEAIQLTKHAMKIGADGTLQVTPYYNKPNQEGLRRHFTEVADVGLPVVLYNIPGRTGIEIAVDTVALLAKHPNIVTLKEAGGSVERVSMILSICDICVVSGDDSLTLPMMVVGAKGVISVVSNVAPSAVADMVHSAMRGDWEKARKLHKTLYRLFRDLFMDTNPIPVKAAMAMMGKIEETYRLPLYPMNEDAKGKLADCLKQQGLI